MNVSAITSQPNTNLFDTPRMMSFRKSLIVDPAELVTPPLTPKPTKATLSFSVRTSSPGYPQITPDQALLRLERQLLSMPTDLMRHSLLSAIRRKNPRLFFKALQSDLTGLAPIVYTPTVGEACQKYSELYTEAEGLYISIEDKDNVATLINEYAATLAKTPQIIVVTDGSRILGLGDLGIGGMGISVGKLNLYVAGGGVDPDGCLPVILDMGTNNEAIRDDPLYIGLKRPRVGLSEATEFMDKFMVAATEAFPQ
ncbi:hypothetical protein BCR39DRAFT_562463, partial [Naematelia encephala]